MRLRFSIYITALFCILSPVMMQGVTKEKFTVVIDAGHGGKDSGAVDNGVREKDINLGVALKLGDLIKKTLKGVNVVFTRDRDVFLTLQERADKANKAKGNLFISIHTNSVDKKNPKRKNIAGASTYALGLHKDKSNMLVAQRENSVIELESDFKEKYSGFDPNSDESYIIFELSQKNNLNQSITFADYVQKEMSKAGRRDRGVHQAGFWVLWATSMPAVLIELDFICNPNSAKYMASQRGQKELARSICNAVDHYRKNLEGKNFAAIPSASDDVSDSGDRVTVLTSAEQRTMTEAPQYTSRSASANALRRRRSAAAKEQSLRQNYEADIKVYAEADGMPAKVETEKPGNNSSSEQFVTPTVATEELATSKQATSGKGKAGSKKKVRKQIAAKEATASTKRQSRSIMQRMHKKRGMAGDNSVRRVFKIQILSTDKNLSGNAPEFCGFKPVSRFKEGDLFKYTVGEADNKKDLEGLLRQVRSKIPDAFIIERTIDSK